MLFCLLNFALHSGNKAESSLRFSQYVYKGPRVVYLLRKVFENIYYPR